MSRVQGIANGLQKKSTTAGVHQLDVAVCVPSPQERKGYILNQCVTIAVIFFLAGRDPGQPALSTNTVPSLS